MDAPVINFAINAFYAQDVTSNAKALLTLDDVGKFNTRFRFCGLNEVECENIYFSLPNIAQSASDLL